VKANNGVKNNATLKSGYKPKTRSYLTTVVCTPFILACQCQITQVIETYTWIIRRH